MKVLIALTLCLALSQAETLPDREGRIVGGSETVIANAPYQAALLSQDTPTILRFICGGVIISASWILTAAQCTFGNPATKFKVRIGSDQHSKGGNLHTIAELHNHPEYSKVVSGDYDVALLRVYTPIVLVKSVKEAVKLVTSGSNIDDTTQTSISGWGKTGSTALNYPAKLRVAMVWTKSQVDCVWSYCKRQEITARMVCAGNPGVDGCNGDAGGPMVRESDGLLVGIVSVVNCADPNLYSIYTRVAFVRDWIKRNSNI